MNLERIENGHSYSKVRLLGTGAYGKIYLIKIEGHEFALKRIKTKGNDGIDLSAIREIKILREIVHPNIIKVHRAFIEKGKRMCLVMDYCPFDLSILIREKKTFFFHESEAAEIMLQMLEAVHFLHTKAIIHRDIKPSNILMNMNAETKLIDFGLARHFKNMNDPLTKGVVTRWYRSPEILFGAIFYGTKVDIWALGCVFAEMLLKKPLFPGNSEINQLSRIFGIRGLPDFQSWPEAKTLPYYLEFEECFEIPLKKILNNASPEAIDIIDKMLTLNPKKRPNSQDLLDSDYFKNLNRAKAMQTLSQKLANLKNTH